MNKEELRNHLSSLGFIISEKTIQNLEDFSFKTLEVNKSFNLTAITDIESFREKMVYDSALGMVGLDLTNKKVIDVGTGAGFPGMVIYILDNNINLTLLDSTAKKINHLEKYAKEAEYHIDFVIDRIEEYAHKNIEKYDYAFARAVASLNILLEMIMPIIKVGGYFIALKGAKAEEEINEAKNAIKVMGAKVVSINKYILPESHEERNVLIIEKIKNTSKKYPRSYADIKKRPL